MSNIKISNLPLIPSISPDDVLPIVDSGFTTTYKVKVSQLVGASGSSGTSGTSGVGFNWQGGWQSITTYYENDVVYYSGASYVALGTIAAGGNPPDVNASWENMNAQGASGTNGTSGSSGVSGTSGSSGTSGQNGSSGTSGSSGSSGSSGINGQSVDVYSGGTLIVSAVQSLNFSGATIVSGGTGQADIVITPSSSSPYIAGNELNSVISDYSTTQPLYPYTQILGGSGNTFTSQSNTFVSMNDFDVVWAPILNYNAGVSGISLGNKNSSLRGGVNVANYNMTNTSNSDAGTYIDNVSGTIYAPGHAVVIGCNAPNLNVNGGVFLSSYAPTATGGAIRSVFISGYNNTKNNDGDINTFLNSTQSTIGGTTNWCYIGNSNSSSINGGNYNSIHNTTTSSIAGGNYNSIFGGSNNSFGNGVASSTITASYNNTNIQGLNLCFIAGTQDNTITSMGYTYALIGGGYNTINATNASAGNAMYSSYFCTDSTINSGANSNNWFSGSRDCGQTGYGKYNWITNSYNSNINNNTGSEQNEWFNKIDSSSASTITTSKSSQIIGGEGNTISGKTDVVMIGCNNRTAPTNTATMVENLVVFNYGNLNYADDTAAAAGGVVLGQVYHTAGILKIRVA